MLRVYVCVRMCMIEQLKEQLLSTVGNSKYEFDVIVCGVLMLIYVHGMYACVRACVYV